MDNERAQGPLLIDSPPKLAISLLINRLKGVSSRLPRRDRPDRVQRDDDKGVLWIPSNFAGRCGGVPISIIRQYIAQQRTASDFKPVPDIPALQDGDIRLFE